MSNLIQLPADFLLGICGQPPVAGDMKGCQTKLAGGAGS